MTQFLSNKVKKSIESKKPLTPFMMYYNHSKLVDPNTNYHDLREKYPNLPITERYKWIVKAVQLAPDVSLRHTCFNLTLKPLITLFIRMLD